MSRYLLLAPLWVVCLGNCAEDEPPKPTRTGLCSTVYECAQLAAEAAQRSENAALERLPAGAVLMFAEPCPEGFKDMRELAGRFPLAAGEGVTEAGALTARKVNEKGGQEKVILTEEQMPPHSHKIHDTDHNNTPEHVDYSPEEYGLYKAGRGTTSVAGAGAAHENMPPFLVLHFCKRM